jgi:hypothetical protein
MLAQAPGFVGGGPAAKKWLPRRGARNGSLKRYCRWMCSASLLTWTDQTAWSVLAIEILAKH